MCDDGVRSVVTAGVWVVTPCGGRGAQRGHHGAPHRRDKGETEWKRREGRGAGPFSKTH